MAKISNSAYRIERDSMLC